MPVVGGYLAYIGFYCLEAAVSTMTDQDIEGIKDWPKVFHKDYLILMTPGIIFGALLLLMSQHVKSVFALPAALCEWILPTTRLHMATGRVCQRIDLVVLIGTILNAPACCGGCVRKWGPMVTRFGLLTSVLVH
jgi:hypothetical protein